jgi:hypothetical protein
MDREVEHPQRDQPFAVRMNSTTCRSCRRRPISKLSSVHSSHAACAIPTLSTSRCGLVASGSAHLPPSSTSLRLGCTSRDPAQPGLALSRPTTRPDRMTTLVWLCRSRRCANVRSPSRRRSEVGRGYRPARRQGEPVGDQLRFRRQTSHPTRTTPTAARSGTRRCLAITLAGAATPDA